jgi:hypothetical protein
MQPRRSSARASNGSRGAHGRHEEGSVDAAQDDRPRSNNGDFRRDALPWLRPGESTDSSPVGAHRGSAQASVQ